jgi:hypothetical protein
VLLALILVFLAHQRLKESHAAKNAKNQILTHGKRNPGHTYLPVNANPTRNVSIMTTSGINAIKNVISIEKKNI